MPNDDLESWDDMEEDCDPGKGGADAQRTIDNFLSGSPFCLTDDEMEVYAHGAARDDLPYDAELDFLSALARFGGDRRVIDSTIVGHFQGCGSCFERYNEAVEFYNSARCSLAPKVPEPEACGDVRRNSGAYSFVDMVAIARRRSSNPPPEDK